MYLILHKKMNLSLSPINQTWFNQGFYQSVRTWISVSQSKRNQRRSNVKCLINIFCQQIRVFHTLKTVELLQNTDLIEICHFCERNIIKQLLIQKYINNISSDLISCKYFFTVGQNKKKTIKQLRKLSNKKVKEVIK